MEIANTNKAIINQVKSIIEQARQNVSLSVNHELLHSYWQIGKLIADNEKPNGVNDTSARSFILELSKELSAETGKGFSRSNLFNMRSFYLNFPDVQTPSGQLSWSHYCELLSISDESKRSFYKKETQNSRWSVRELKRQISTSLYERLILSDGKTNKETVLSLAQEGIEMSKPTDIKKTPTFSSF